MSEHFWYKEKFYRPEAPDDIVRVEFHTPVELKPQTWQCEVRIEADESIRQRIRASSSFAAIQLAFQYIRKVILEKYPDYLHNGVERVEHLIPRPIEWFYGDEIRLKTEAFMDELHAAKNDEIRQKWLAWARANPDWVKDNLDLMSQEDLDAIRNGEDGT